MRNVEIKRVYDARQPPMAIEYWSTDSGLAE
jgi:hypothetical protein